MHPYKPEGHGMSIICSHFPSCLWNRWSSRGQSVPPSLISFCLYTNHYLFPSIPNVHAVSVQTTGTLLQAYFPDGSHLPASLLLSLAHLWDDSQHISLAAICLSAFTANQTSEQPNSLMGGGLETSPARLPAPPYLPPVSPNSTSSYFPISCQKNFFLLCFIFWVIISDPVLISISLWPSQLLLPIPPQPPAPTPLHHPPSHFCSRWQGAAIYSTVPAREWAMCVSPMVAEGAAEPNVNIRCESSHL